MSCHPPEKSRGPRSRLRGENPEKVSFGNGRLFPGNHSGENKGYFRNFMFSGLFPGVLSIAAVSPKAGCRMADLPEERLPGRPVYHQLLPGHPELLGSGGKIPRSLGGIVTWYQHIVLYVLLFPEEPDGATALARG